MSTAAATQPSTPLRFGRHIVGMMILALASPYVWYGSERTMTWAMTWAMTWLVPVGMALAAFGLFALFFTSRAKAAWPGRFFMLAWVLLALVVAAPYLETFNRSQAVKHAEQPAPAVQQEARPAAQDPAYTSPPGFKPFTGKLDGE